MILHDDFTKIVSLIRYAVRSFFSSNCIFFRLLIYLFLFLLDANWFCDSLLRLRRKTTTHHHFIELIKTLYENKNSKYLCFRALFYCSIDCLAFLALFGLTCFFFLSVGWWNKKKAVNVYAVIDIGILIAYKYHGFLQIIAIC